MTVLDRDALDASPLADLHLLANELGVDGFRRLRRDDLVEQILGRADGQDVAAEGLAGPLAADGEAPEAEAKPKPRSRVRRKPAPADAAAEAEPEAEADVPAAEAVDEDEDAPRPRRRSRGGRGRKRADAEGVEVDAASDPERDEPRGRRADPERQEEDVVEGALELLSGGSGLIRLGADDDSDEDVYVSPAQVKRCELVSGDRVSGPVRPRRRSERYRSLVRVATINGRDADEVVEGTKFDDLPATWPTERLALDTSDATLKAVEWLTPLGKGSRATIVGPSRSGKSVLLRHLGEAIAKLDGLEVTCVLAGVRPEELRSWDDGSVAPTAALSFAASPDALAQAVETAIDTGRRVAARGGDAVVLVDSLELLAPQARRRALAAARNVEAGGSLTVVATAAEPVGGETTVICLDPGLVAQRRFPALDLARSGTIAAEHLVGEAGVEATARARTESLA